MVHVQPGAGEEAGHAGRGIAEPRGDTCWATGAWGGVSRLLPTMSESGPPGTSATQRTPHCAYPFYPWGPYNHRVLVRKSNLAGVEGLTERFEIPARMAHTLNTSREQSRPSFLFEGGALRGSPSGASRVSARRLHQRARHGLGMPNSLGHLGQAAVTLPVPWRRARHLLPCCGM